MIKIFTTNKDGKIELTKEELKSLLDDSYWEGYRARNLTYTYTYSTPNWTPYTCTVSGTNTTITSNAFSNDTSNTVSANEVR